MKQVRIHCGQSTAQGNRSQNQDAHFSLYLPESAWEVHGVLDGHGDFGQAAANEAARWLQQEFQREPLTATTPDENFFTELFERLDRHLFQADGDTPEWGDPWLSGTTCVLALLNRNEARGWIASCGDSRAILGSQDSSQNISVKPLSRLLMFKNPLAQEI